MLEEPIVEEIRNLRQEHAARFSYDLDAIYQDLKAKEVASRRVVVSRPPRLHLKATGT
jgi:hypothetical protein